MQLVISKWRATIAGTSWARCARRADAEHGLEREGLVVFVDTEHGINTAIRKLRYLLREDPDRPQYIQTVTGMGYRFVSPVSAVEPVLASAKTASPETVPQPLAAAGSSSRRRRLGWYVVAGVCVVLAIAVVRQRSSIRR